MIQEINMYAKATMTMVIALVAMIGLTGLAMATTGTTTSYTGDGAYDMTYTGNGGGDFMAQTFTNTGYDRVVIAYDADMSGSQEVTASNGWTEIDREARTDDGYGMISTFSQDNTGWVDNTITTTVSSDNYAKVIGQNVGISIAYVSVETYQAAANDGVMRADANAGSIIGGTYQTGVILSAEDHSVLYTDASAVWGDTGIGFDTDMDSRGLPYGGTDGDGQLVVYTDTTANFGQDLAGTYDTTSFTVDIGGSDGYTQTLIDFDDTCDVTGYAGTSYWYGFPVAP